MFALILAFARYKKVQGEERIQSQSEKQAVFLESENLMKSAMPITKDVVTVARKRSFESRKNNIIDKLTRAGVYKNSKYGVIYISLSLYDNFSFYQNGEKYYVAASTVKIPYAMVLNERVNNKKLSLENTYVKYTGTEHIVGAGDITKNGKIGESYKLKKVIYEMVVNSDNTATRILTKNYPYLRTEMKKYSNVKNPVLNEYLYAKPQFYVDVLKKVYVDPSYDYTKKLLLKADDHWDINPSDKPIASKWGSYRGNISQVGIVYDERPYIIIIFREKGGKVPLSEIGKIFYEDARC